MQWSPEAQGDYIISDWSYLAGLPHNERTLYYVMGWEHNRHVREIYVQYTGKLALPEDYADALPARPEEVHDLIKAEVWGYEEHYVVTDPAVLQEIEDAMQSAEERSGIPKTYVLCYPLCLERADGVKLYAYPMMMDPGEESQDYQAGDVWFRFKSPSRDLWDMLGYRP